MGSSSPRWLLLERAERCKVTLGVDDLFHRSGTEGTDQLVLKVCDARVKTESFPLGTREVGAEAGSLETAPEVVLLCVVTQARQSYVEPPRAEPIEEASDVLRTAHRHDGDALSIEVPTTAHSEGLERELVADPFNEDDRTCKRARSRPWAIEVGDDPWLLVVARPHAEQVIE